MGLNQDDLNLRGPHSRSLRGEWKVINDMLREAAMIGLKLRQRARLRMRQTTAGESEVGVGARLTSTLCAENPAWDIWRPNAVPFVLVPV